MWSWWFWQAGWRPSVNEMWMSRCQDSQGVLGGGHCQKVPVGEVAECIQELESAVQSLVKAQLIEIPTLWPIAQCPRGCSSPACSPEWGRDWITTFSAVPGPGKAASKAMPSKTCSKSRPMSQQLLRPTATTCSIEVPYPQGLGWLLWC